MNFAVLVARANELEKVVASSTTDYRHNLYGRCIVSLSGAASNPTMGNGAKAAERRARNLADAKKGPSSQLKSNEAAKTIKCKTCFQSESISLACRKHGH